MVFGAHFRWQGCMSGQEGLFARMAAVRDGRRVIDAFSCMASVVIILEGK